MNQAQTSLLNKNGWLAPAAVLAALLLGGGGRPEPVPELLLQLVLAACFCLWLWQRSVDGQARPIPVLAWSFVGLFVALPAIQLIPLPPALWQAMPGREVEIEALTLIGAQDSWRSLSVNPARTLAVLLCTLASAAVLLFTVAADRRERDRIAEAVTLAVILTLLLGAMQLAGGFGGPTRFYIPQSNYLDGFQGNHNSTADLILIGMMASALVLRQRIERRRLPENRVLILSIAAGVTAVFLIGLILTASRTGIMLAPIALAAQATILWPWLRGNRRAIGVTMAGGAAMALVLALLLQGNAVMQNVMARFDFTSETRPEIWRDSYLAAMKSFPFGTGMGTFAPTFQSFERLEVVATTVSKRAHNEVLELMVEGGALALFVLVAGLILLVIVHVRATRSSDGLQRARAQFASSSLMVLMVHSLVDYPFRSMSLACLAAACTGLLVAIAAERGRPAAKAKLREEA